MKRNRLTPAKCGDRPENHDNENQAGGIEADQEPAERDKRAGAELADRERDGAERPDRRRPHHDGDDAEEHLRGGADQVGEWLSGLPHGAQGKAAQHRDEEHLQHVALSERADEGVGNDAEQELRGGAVTDLGQIGRDGRSVDMRKIDVHAGAGREEIHRDEAEHKRNTSK